MTIYEALNFNREVLEKLKSAGVRLEDCAYIDLYSDYEKLIGGGNKVSYIVAHLAEKYRVSERRVYYLIKHFRSECKSGAA